MYILIAEDQHMSRVILATHLRNWGHTVIETTDGAEALEYLSSSNANIDMLITDWNMPKVDGVELARRVRSLSLATQYIYIILLTAKNEFDDMILGFSQGGVDDYMVKPFEAAELKLRIQVGNRLVQAERTQRLYSQSLERIVRKQTEHIRETQGEIISRLFSALESRDEETAGHVRRIGVMSSFLGDALGWDATHVDSIRAAAPLHDIGKIGVADSILRKPGLLTPEEFEQIKLHTVIGAKILSNSHNPVIQMAEIIAKYHHENWDGSGYLEGLSGTDIPEEARVVAIADVYDALLSDRVYRPGMPEEAVLRIIQSERGRKFDPEICDIFLNNLEEIKAIMAKAEKELMGYNSVI